MRLLWPVLALVLSHQAAQAYQLDCYQQPDAQECNDFTPNNTTLAADLAAVCQAVPDGANSTGWPAACTLYYECSAGRVMPRAQQCQPLTLLLTACGESPELPQCSK